MCDQPQEFVILKTSSTLRPALEPLTVLCITVRTPGYFICSQRMCIMNEFICLGASRWQQLNWLRSCQRVSNWHEPCRALGQKL